ncbi:hypothetical protein NUACC21_29900 [Scytonema sp. NUACC21]
MKVAAQQEDLQFLAQILQEQLRAEVPSGELFQVKCAVKNDQLMVLAQHPVGVAASTETVFAVLEEALQSLPGQQEQHVELFLRVIGQKLPYTKSSIVLRKPVTFDAFEIEELGLGEEDGGYEENEMQRHGDSLNFSEALATSYSYSSDEDSNSLDEPADEAYDPMADAPDLSTYTSSKPAGKVKTVLVGVALAVVTALGCAAYLLTRPCSMFECQELQTARQLQGSLRQLKLNANSEKELPNMQKQLETTSSSLKEVPFWSPYHQEAEKLSENLSGQAEKLSQVVKAFEAGSVAVQKSQTPASSIQELENRQKLWRAAIAPLEVINSNSEIYKLVQPKLLIYRSHLKAVKHQLLAEEKWMKKLSAAKAVAMEASKRDATAKSLPELQKVQSTWQVAVNALAAIPPTSSAYREAQKLLGEYKPYLTAARIHATKELLAAKTYNQAVNTANLAKRYEQQNQLQAAVSYWDRAVNAAKQVSSDSMYYNQAQALVAPYSTALKQAQEKLQAVTLVQRTRTDLNKTCYSTIRVCNYTVDKQGISVQLTPEYQRIMQTSFANASNQSSTNTGTEEASYWQKLQQALEIISDNAGLPLIIYDVQGNAISVHNPVG